MKQVLLALAISLIMPQAFAVKPDPKLTQGELCTPTNPDFVGYRYSAHVAYCRRSVSREMKIQIAQAYGGILESDWSKYEFDHLIPLNAGGDSSFSNLWPQPIAEAKEKDLLEQHIFDGLNKGALTQSQAVQMVWDWINSH